MLSMMYSGTVLDFLGPDKWDSFVTPDGQNIVSLHYTDENRQRSKTLRIVLSLFSPVMTNSVSIPEF